MAAPPVENSSAAPSTCSRDVVRLTNSAPLDAKNRMEARKDAADA
jgi:hypothetical protein